LCTIRTAIDPSPAAEATRLIEPLRTSPAASTPLRLVSSGSQLLDEPHPGTEAGANDHAEEWDKQQQAEQESPEHVSRGCPGDRMVAFVAAGWGLAGAVGATASPRRGAPALTRLTGTDHFLAASEGRGPVVAKPLRTFVPAVQWALWPDPAITKAMRGPAGSPGAFPTSHYKHTRTYDLGRICVLGVCRVAGDVPSTGRCAIELR
jgi:hypothetical protein